MLWELWDEHEVKLRKKKRAPCGAEESKAKQNTCNLRHTKNGVGAHSFTTLWGQILPLLQNMFAFSVIKSLMKYYNNISFKKILNKLLFFLSIFY